LRYKCNFKEDLIFRSLSELTGWIIIHKFGSQQIKMFRRFSFYTIIFFFSIIDGFSQITGPEQDCPSAIPICQTQYQQNLSYAGGGLFRDFTDTSLTCLKNWENNSVWYIFTVTQSGILEMSITPLQQDDYDFAIYNITNSGCSDILLGNNLPVRCSYYGLPGTTGLRIGYSSTSAGVADTAFLAPLNVTLGETYVILVDNYNIGGGGYILDFTTNSPNAASIIDVTPPTMVGIRSTSCTPTRFLILDMSENILCSSIDTLGAQFSITGPSNVTVTGASGTDCGIGAFSNSIIIELDTPIYLGGLYTLNLHSGTNGLRISDYCGNAAADAGLPFNMPDIVVADFNYTINASCLKDTFYFTDQTLGTPIAWNWNFGDGTTSTQQNPVHTFPDTNAYTVTLITSSADCSDTISQFIDVTSSFAPDFTITPSQACIGDTIIFTDNSPSGATNYLWRFGDGSISGDQNPQYSYSTSGTFRVTLVISDPSTPGCSDSSFQFITITPVPDASFVADADPLCSGAPVRFTDASTGNIISYFWDFGDGNTSADNIGLNIFAVGGNYDVTHIINDALCGSDTVTQSYTVIQRPIVSLGNDTAICLSETIVLAGPANAETYRWSTGQTTRTITFSAVPDEVSLTITANGCTSSDVVFINERKEDCYYVKVPSAFSPNGDGHNDFLKIFLLRIQSFELKIFNRWGEMVFETNNATFGWDGRYKDELQDMGVFQYYIDGVSISGEKFFRTGNITLLR
jgi:gliding motility-associated-like protein